MIETKGGYKFESTGREVYTCGLRGISLDFSCGNALRYGSDGGFDQLDDDEESEHTTQVTPEEKKEIALYVIKQWSDWAGLNTPNGTENTL